MSCDYIYSYDLQKKLSKKGYFCNFCLRNEFNEKNNIMKLTFNPIIYFYYNQYLNKSIFFSQIIDIIECHKKTGLLHPNFHYDEESFNWFVVFNEKNKNYIENIVKNILNIAFCFNLSQNVLKFNYKEFYNNINDYCFNFLLKNTKEVLTIGGSEVQFNLNNMVKI